MCIFCLQNSSNVFPEPAAGLELSCVPTFPPNFLKLVERPGGGGGVLREKLGMGVRPACQNPYPIYDQNLRFSLPYL